MGRYIKRPRPEAIDEDFIALVLLVGPLAWPSRRREVKFPQNPPTRRAGLAEALAVRHGWRDGSARDTLPALWPRVLALAER